eukprot:gene10463-14054_t
MSHRRALPIHINATEPIRLNILMCGLDSGFHLLMAYYIFQFAIQAGKGYIVRWINVDKYSGFIGSEMLQHMTKYEGLEEFDKYVSYVHNGPAANKIGTNPNDIFAATIFYTTHIASGFYDSYFTVKNVPQSEYKEVLVGAAIGLSLMISPHPSLPPFDFAAAGGCVVVNIIAAKPSLQGIVNGLKLTITRVNDLSARQNGTILHHWSTTWDDDRMGLHHTNRGF